MATATKNEPKAGQKQNKSALIREYVKAHRTATAKEISEKFGCSEALVHHVRNRLKGKRKSKLTANAPTNAITSAVFSPDGKQILSSSRDRTARLWEVATGKEIRSYEGHRGEVMDAVFSKDGQFVLTGSADRMGQ